ncbi:MAG: excinuclease ABC subunit UvrB [Vampirovibrionales bacterium]
MFQLASDYSPSGDQPHAIETLVDAFAHQGLQSYTLLGATGTGKTFTMANVINQLQRPTLILAHNKTLAAQLYNEFKTFFPNNAVEYFISYYDFYQPEAYIPRTDTYIEKSASINDDIDRMRHGATRSLFERPDAIVVASVSCIYGLGMPECYLNAAIRFNVGESYERDALLHQLMRNQYQRNDLEMKRTHVRVRGDVMDIFPATEEWILRLSFFDDELESMEAIDATTGDTLFTLEQFVLYPAVHFVAEDGYVERGLQVMKDELKTQLAWLRSQGKELEASRLEQRTRRDMEMIKELGYCPGIENYSRIFEGRPPGTPPKTLLDYFPENMLLMIDESHVTIPQLRGMYHGDKSRKQSLVDYGFRLPAARDNRPLTFDEFEARIGQRLYVSATPSKYELADCTLTLPDGSEQRHIVEQIIRPTGLLDPLTEIIPTEGQIDTVVAQCQTVIQRNERVLITTLTKRMAEDLTEYLQGINIRVRYIHSDVKPIERIEILRDLRLGTFDVLVGVNLLREGLDLPEVSLVCIMDADKEGFLRSDSALLQIIGRAARNAAGKVLLFADTVTDSMQRALDETARRRSIQMNYNLEHGIVPKTIRKPMSNGLLELLGGGSKTASTATGTTLPEGQLSKAMFEGLPAEQQAQYKQSLEAEMRQAAKELDFERAATLRDELLSLEALLVQP